MSALLPAAFPGLRVQNLVQPGDLLAGQEPRERRAAVPSDAPGRIGFDMTAGDGEVHDLPQHVDGAVGRRPAPSGCSGRTIA